MYQREGEIEPYLKVEASITKHFKDYVPDPKAVQFVFVIVCVKFDIL